MLKCFHKQSWEVLREGENNVQKWGVFTTKVQRFDSDAKMWPQTKLRSSASRLGEKLEGFAKLRVFLSS